MPLPSLIALTLVFVYGLVLLHHLWGVRREAIARRKRLEARIAELGRLSTRGHAR